VSNGSYRAACLPGKFVAAFNVANGLRSGAKRAYDKNDERQEKLYAIVHFAFLCM
jgi:hypothetical protein